MHFGYFVNISLLLFFITLAGSGLIRFFQPFDIVTTRVHIFSGVVVLILVALHLFGRLKFLVQYALRPRRAQKSRKRGLVLFGALLVWCSVLVSALYDLSPARLLTGLSYESRHKETIFRPDPQAVYQEVGEGIRVKRSMEDNAHVLLEIEWGDAWDKAEKDIQAAVWVESQRGDLVETLFVSEASAFANPVSWGGETVAREEILPIWSAKREARLQAIKEEKAKENQGGADGLSRATVVNDLRIEQFLQMNSQPFYIYLEVNLPGDENKSFQSKPAGTMPKGVGQPSVLWSAFVGENEGRNYYLMSLVGHSGDDPDSKGELDFDLERLTTASEIVEKIVVRAEMFPKSKNEQ